MVHSSNHSSSLSLPQKIASAGLAGCTADLCTFPLDTVKVWLQVRGETTAPQASLAASGRMPIGGNSSVSTASSLRSSLTSERLKPVVFQQKVTSFKPTGKSPLKKHSRTKQAVSTNQKTQNQGNAQRTGKPSATSQGKPKTINTKLSPNFAQLSKPSFSPAASVRAGSGTAVAVVRSNPGLFGTIMHNVRAHGPTSLYGGLAAGLQRQVAFCAVRIGLYDSIKGFYQKLLPGSQGKQMGQRVLAGTTSAFIAVALFQPTEVVKIRMQAQTSKPPEARLYSSSFQAYRSIFKVGVKEAWKGLETNAARLAVVNVCELVTYDVVKETILDYQLMRDNPACHFTSAFLSGFITTVVASPIDVVKTRYMNSKNGRYRGPLHCARAMLTGEGLRSFYKGFVPAYLRLGSWNIVMFVSYEQYKRIFVQHNKRDIVTSREANFVSNIE